MAGQVSLSAGASPRFSGKVRSCIGYLAACARRRGEELETLERLDNVMEAGEQMPKSSAPVLRPYMPFANVAEAAASLEEEQPGGRVHAQVEAYWAARTEEYWAARRALIPPALPPGGASAGQVEAYREELQIHEERLRELAVKFSEIERARQVLGLVRAGSWV